MPTARPELIYLDHNATTPVRPEVVEAMRDCYAAPYLNPASQHEFGRRARRVLEAAREKVGELVGANMSGRDADRVVFTSGGTEANNLALLGLAGEDHFSSPGNSGATTGHLIISAIEHPSVTAVTDHLAAHRWSVDRLGVDRGGVIRSADLPALLRPGTRLVAAMLANNETGVIQPMTELAAICVERRVPLHTDAAQAVGKLPVHFRDLGVATMSFAAHKFHGPLGIGALVVRHDVELAPQLFGGFQQGGLRPGTESVALAVGMLRALELWHSECDDRNTRLTNLRNEFERAIRGGWPAAVVIGAAADRLPNSSNIAFVGLDRQALFIALDQAGVACSTGSACASGSSEPSPTHLAMGLDATVLGSALRFSLGAGTTDAELNEATRRILKICNDLGSKKVG
ncbi:MAG TPA: cysteine desulfurase family protein [Lacipirellulaceae bacterium]